MTTEIPQAGWYPDPTGAPGRMYWDGQEWHQDETTAAEAALAPSVTPQVAVQGQPQPGNYAYKNPLLYAFGGLFVPPLVLFLMGGSRTTCLWMIGVWVLFWLTVWVFFLGFILLPPLYIWSVVACYQEAGRQNRAHGFAS
jgi:hypothetical protein